MASNVMMQSSMYSETPHPIVRSKSYDFKRRVTCVTRTERPVKYYFTDFGISCRLPENVTDPRETPIMGGDRSVPEHQRPIGPQNPYRTDVYCLGNLFRTQFLQKYSGLEFLNELVGDMVKDDPQARPTITEACLRFKIDVRKTKAGRLRSRIVPQGEHAVAGFFRACRHIIRTAKFVATGRPALPSPESAVRRQPAPRGSKPPTSTSKTTDPTTSESTPPKSAASKKRTTATTAPTPTTASKSASAPEPNKTR
ncbi:hypothetical protein TRAPUB_8106 [Trametes pubescens]|uniref:Protein kinase domain-containing protein n=1 Tax=Trametes pubescens TaxID=154538 RepID=A0A1M2W6E6_TRAPU|nr:hypothetical protein TRAPUB_8106 [Trametes pubescens]